MIRQVSAWGQFWFTLSANHGINRCGITTPMQRPEPSWRGKPYYCTWFRKIPGGFDYRTIQGDTMTDLLRNGLAEWGVETLTMKLLLLAVVLEEITYHMEKRL